MLQRVGTFPIEKSFDKNLDVKFTQELILTLIARYRVRFFYAKVCLSNVPGESEAMGRDCA